MTPCAFLDLTNGMLALVREVLPFLPSAKWTRLAFPLVGRRVLGQWRRKETLKAVSRKRHLLFGIHFEGKKIHLLCRP